jgi:hypothetical protein
MAERLATITAFNRSDPPETCCPTVKVCTPTGQPAAGTIHGGATDLR